jgi:uncharacterized OB-fold protein
MTSLGLPIPVADRDTQPFWDGCSKRNLVLQHCDTCDRWIWQPRPICSSCGGEPSWRDADGAGTVASWTVIHPPVLPGYAGRTPFVILLVELDIGPRLLGYLVDDGGEWLVTDGVDVGLTMGARVDLRWHLQDDLVLPSWTLPAST